MMMSIKSLQIFFESIKNKITEKTWDALEYDKDDMNIKFESNNILPTDVKTDDEYSHGYNNNQSYFCSRW